MHVGAEIQISIPLPDPVCPTLRFIINGGRGQNKQGGFKDFEKLINRGVKISGGWGQNIKEKRRK